jgi:hypothetical protein
MIEEIRINTSPSTGIDVSDNQADPKSDLAL